MKASTKFLLSLIFAFSVSQSFAQTIQYVTPTGAGNFDGSGWQNAMGLQQFRQKISLADSNTHFWMAAGTYTPHNTERDSAFRIPKKVHLYGGFAGNETQLNQRNPAANITIFSGEINTADSTDNSKNILLFDRSDSAFVDGFTIQDSYGKSAIINNTNAAGFTHSRIFINNCVFHNNVNLQGGGGAIYIFPFRGIASAKITNCTFNNNSSTTDNGGAIRLHLGWEFFETQTNVEIDGCTFTNNSANIGGAVALWGITRTLNSAKMVIKNSNMIGNSAQTGGAIGFNLNPYAVVQPNVGVYTFSMDSCYFLNNTAINTSVLYYQMPRVDSSFAMINHCRFDSNNVVRNNPGGSYSNTLSFSSASRTNKTYILNSGFYSNGRFNHINGNNTVAIGGQDVGADSTFIYNTLFDNCNNGQPVLSIQSFNGKKMATYFVNSTIFKDSVATNGGWATIKHETIQNTGTGTQSDLYVYNSILWPSTSHWNNVNLPNMMLTTSSQYATPGSAKTYIKNSILNTFADPGGISLMGVNLGGNSNARPRFKDTANADYHLVCSTGINQGDATLYNQAIAGLQDADGHPRFTDNIDIGAMEHQPDSAMVAINAPGPICTGQTASFSATLQNGGSSPQLQWFLNGALVATGPTFASSTINNNDVLSVVLTSSVECIDKPKDTASITLTTVAPSPAATLSITAPTMPVCTGSNLSFAAVASNVQNVSYQWKVNGATVGGNITTYASSALQNDDKVSVSIIGTHNGCAGPAEIVLHSDTITVALTQPIAPTVAISQTPDGDVLPFTITVLNPLPNWVYTLYRNNINTNQTGTLFSNINQPGEYFVKGNGGGCYTSTEAQSITITKTAVPSNPEPTAFSIFPNPVKDVLYVSGIQPAWEWIQLGVYDAKGSLVIKKNIQGQTTMVVPEFRQLAAGVYKIKFINAKSKAFVYSVVK